jgi:hypothetical protein
MEPREDDWEEFRRKADALIQRFRVEGSLDVLRGVLGRLLSSATTMNLGDAGDFALLGEEFAERAALDALDDLGCLAVLRPKRDRAVKFELFSKRRLAYLAEGIDAVGAQSS